MKKIITSLFITFFIGLLIGFILGCADETAYKPETKKCEYQGAHVCGTTGDRYYLCSDSCGVWWEVGSPIREYYTTAYMFEEECGW